LAKKGQVHRARSWTIPILPIVGIAAAPVTGYAIGYALQGDWVSAVKQLGGFAGIRADNGQFNFGVLMQNMGPVVIGMVMHKLASKLGVNRMLASAGLPVIRF